MWDNLKNLSDLAKLFLMLLVYTGSMMWWASKITVTVDDNAAYKKDNAKIMATIAQQTLVNTKFIENMQKQIITIHDMEDESLKMHAKCGALMDIMLQRLDKVEEQERQERQEGHK